MYSETYSEAIIRDVLQPSETSEIEPFAKIVDYIQPLIIFAKDLLLFDSQGYEYASDKTKQIYKKLGLQSLEIFF